jgi:hypothetical protein
MTGWWRSIYWVLGIYDSYPEEASNETIRNRNEMLKEIRMYNDNIHSVLKENGEITYSIAPCSLDAVYEEEVWRPPTPHPDFISELHENKIFIKKKNKKRKR